MRAIAALSVLVGHTAAQAHAETAWFGPYAARLNVGVTVFFVISGFLLYRPFVARRMAGRPPGSVLGYARRRVLRIVPAYWVALTCLAIFPGLVGVFSGDSWRYYAMLQIYELRTFLEGLPPAWTLAVELSFYAWLPLYVLLMARVGRRVGAVRSTSADLVALLVLAVASVAFRTWVLTGNGDPIPALWLPGQFAWFAAGMALAVLQVRHAAEDVRPAWIRFVERRPLAVWTGAALVYWALCTRIGLPPLERFPFPASFGVEQYLGQHVLSGLFAALLVLPAVFGEDAGGAPRWLLETRPLVYLGTISYGIFLWHDPFVYKLDEWGARTWLPSSPFVSITLATIAVGVLFGTLSWYLVERPALKLKGGLRGPGPIFAPRRIRGAPPPRRSASAAREPPGATAPHRSARPRL